MQLQGRVPNAHTWAVCKAIIETMIPIVKQCILIWRYWLLFDAMNVTFSLSAVMQNEIEQFDISSSNFVRANFDYEVSSIVDVCDGWNHGNLGSISHIVSIYIVTKTWNMLMLDSCFKSLDVVKDFVGRAKIMQMVVKYDSRLWCHCWWLHSKSKI